MFPLQKRKSSLLAVCNGKTSNREHGREGRGENQMNQTKPNEKERERNNTLAETFSNETGFTREKQMRNTFAFA
jgi:hypothetical protein